MEEALENGHSKDEPNLAEMIAELKAATFSTAEFSSMAKDFCKDGPIFSKT
ncbi:MAG: hypothetical protein WKG06_40820 [Segetibacter sp.]